MNTNPENYKWGLFYFNRSDSRIFVPKMISKTAWTFNFARPESHYNSCVYCHHDDYHG